MQQPHIPDDELLMALDGELAEPRAGEVRRHLRHCWDCRARQARFEQAIGDYMPVHAALTQDPATVPAEGPTARLRASLSAVPLPGPRRLSWLRPALVAASTTAVLVPVALLLWMSGRSLEAAGPLPDARLTPGAVRFISSQQVCRLPAEDEGRLVPADLAKRVFEQYRISHPKPGAYEMDYLISPALGGTTAIQNLWPVPYADGVWTSRVKDALEDHLRTLVCEGRMDLATAQREIATDWIAAYRKHFRARLPVAAHAKFVKDSPWE